MPESKHTPGPWVNGKSGRYPNLPSVEAWEGSFGIEICVCLGAGDYAQATAETHANARLIAAAPDLLAVLREGVASYGRPGGPWNMPKDPGGWISRAQAAIAKAEGRADD